MKNSVLTFKINSHPNTYKKIIKQLNMSQTFQEIKKEIEKESQKFFSYSFPPLPSSSSNLSHFRNLKSFCKRLLKRLLKRFLPRSVLVPLSHFFHLPEHIAYFNQVIADLTHTINALSTQTNELSSQLKALEKPSLPPVYEDTISYLPSSLETLKYFSIPFEKTEEHFYLLFENTFYNHYIVKEKQKLYLPYIREWKKDSGFTSVNFLDIGCGRGEFMNLLREEGFRVEGVESSSLLCEYLTRSGFKVHHQDANTFLSSLSPYTYYAISALQVIEHFEKDYLFNFLNLCYEKLPPSGLLLLETVNPLAATGLGNFYIDFTHIYPIPPQLLIFLLEWIGFKIWKVLYLTPVPPDFQTSFIEKNYQDYAIFALKPCSS
ncbi:MAG: hypothetical protein DRP29_06305 [Thermodesulfobacteriota bacterium]|nr:MAG: hypothetical protein DRP29_06305 [Thermodesulfobacteriota bacterium]